ncbi:nicotinamide mononucleotide transporter family protein [Kitasatospora sp. RB6PN24]|uniref:nicotinamide mononucleotide transporter family protein n=1 Tax=Kitasatospora humi TaxID=2893891 RepID=UPI001E41BCF3|nr:nicotinamide mononucleotide transporter family protein [Kitasatospora humi]MCC9305935.1 nicotinamide mononucleotide transporter family protein [Kitasatospora humi]
MNWLNTVAFTLLGEHFKWNDVIGNTLGLIGLAYGWRRSVLSWPVQLLSGLVLISANLSAHLSGGVGKQLVVIATSIWGWVQWQRGRSQDGDIRIRFATWAERAVLVAGTAVATVAVALVFQHWNLSWSPWADAYIFTGTLAAMIAQARGWVEFWFAWIAVDVVGVPLAFSSGLPFSGLVYLVYFVLVMLGLRSWWLRSRLAKPAPTLQGVTA